MLNGGTTGRAHFPEPTQETQPFVFSITHVGNFKSTFIKIMK